MLLAAAGELAVPVIIQRSVDAFILPYHRGLRLEGLPADDLARLGRPDPGQQVAGTLYVPASRLGP